VQEEGVSVVYSRLQGFFFFYGALDETVVSVSIKAALEGWSVEAQRSETGDCRRLSGVKCPHTAGELCLSVKCPVIFSHLPHFLATLKSPPSRNAEGLTFSLLYLGSERRDLCVFQQDLNLESLLHS